MATKQQRVVFDTRMAYFSFASLFAASLLVARTSDAQATGLTGGVTVFSSAQTGATGLAATGLTGGVTVFSSSAPIGGLSSTALSTSALTVNTGSTGLCATYQAFPSQHALGATPFPALNAAQCMAGCTNNPSCTAYEIDLTPTDPSLCWMHLAPFDITNLFGNPNITLFNVVSRVCTGSSVSSAASTATASTATGSTGAAALCVAITTLSGQHALSAIPQTSLMTAAACQTGCIANPQCVAYEVDTLATDNLCWFHTNSNDLMQSNIFNDNPLVSLFILQRGVPCTSSGVTGSTASGTTASGTTSSVVTSSGASTTAALCGTFNALSNTNALNAVPFPAIMTQAACQQACVSNASCVSFEIDTNPGDAAFCWLHFNAADLVQLFGTNGVTEYILVSRVCPSSTAATGTTTSGTTVSGATTSSAPTVCPATYNAIAVTHSIGATPFPGLTAAQCLAQCNSNPQCVAYEIDMNVGHALCWIHTNATNLLTQYGDPLITQYVVLSRVCPSSSAVTGTASTVSAASAASTTSGPPALCATYTTFTQTNSIGATPIPSITTAAACQAACTNNPQCVAYEIDANPADPLCWIHTNLADLTTLYNAPFVTQYQVSSRICPSTSPATGTTVSGASTVSAASTTSGPPALCATYTTFTQTNSVGATSILSITTAAACQTACTNNPQCVAYEIDTNPADPLCWIHTNLADLATLYNAPLVTQYQVSSRICPSVSTASVSPATGSTVSTVSSAPPTVCATYNMLNMTNSVGATSIPSITTAAACQAACTNNPQCVAYEIDTNPADLLCWIHTNLADLATLYNAPFVTQYQVLSRTCPSVSPATTVSAASTSPVTGTTTAPLFCATYTTLPNTQSTGGTPYPGITTQACQNLCTTNPQCVAYEIDTNPTSAASCWLHTNPSDLLILYDSTTVTQYQVATRGCSSPVSTVSAATTTPPTGTTTAPLVCATYTTLPNTQSTGGTPYPGITTQAGCQNLCTTNPQCVAYEIDTSPTSAASCWLHTNPSDLLILYDSTTVTQYQVATRGCSSPVSTVSAASTSAVSVSAVTSVSAPAVSSTSTSSSAATTSLISVVSTLSTSLVTATSAATTTAPTTTAPTTSFNGCTFTFNLVQNVNSPGGTPNRATNLNDCETACTNNLACIGIDVISTNTTFFCYLTTVSVPLTPYPGNNHYNLVRGALCPTLAPTIGTTAIAATTTVPPLGTGCSSLRVIVGYNSDGGLLIGQMTQAACVQACVQSLTCVAVDYDTSQQLCYTHTTNAGEQLATCCVRYECAPTPCTDTYDSYANQAPDLTQGQVQNGVTTVAGCMSACATANCTEFAFSAPARVATQSCFLYFAASPANLLPVLNQAGVSLYVRKRCIAAPVAVQPTTTTTQTLPSNYCPVDMVFVIDSSGSIRDNQPPGVDNWSLILTFVSDIITSYLSVAPNMDHVAVVIFSSTAQISFNFNQYQTLATLLPQIQNLPYIGYETNTPAALMLAYQLYTDPTQGARARSAKIMVLITDGMVTSTWVGNYQPAINLIATLNVTRYAVGVTTAIDASQLLAFASSPNAYTTVTSFSDLGTVSVGLGTYIDAVTCGGQVVLTSLLTSPTTTTTVTTTTTTNPPTTTSTTTTPITTTTTIVSSSTSPTTTTTPQQVLLTGEGLFTAITNISVAASPNPVPFASLYANRNNVYSLVSNSFTSTAVSGFYFTEICSGMSAGTTSELKNRGGFPSLGFTWLSTAQNGIISGCRGGVYSLTRGVQITLLQTGTSSYSDGNWETSWSLFSISDIIVNTNSILSALYTTNFQAPGPIKFINPIANPPGMYNPSQGQYSCGATGTFFVSFSVGVPAGQTAQVQLVGLDNTYELIRTSTVQNGVTTMDRTVIVQCFSALINVQVIAGQVTPGNSSTNLISFNAFQYSLAAGQSAAWGLYRSSSLSSSPTATDPLPFDTQIVANGVSVNNNAVIIQTGGYYYVYISVGAQAGQLAQLSLKVNGVVWFNVIRAATNDNGLDTLGHGMVIQLKTNDVVRVSSEANAALYSAATGLHTSFLGMLLYTA